MIDLFGATEATPDSLSAVEMRRKMALALLNKAGDSSPVQAWSQGLARVSDGLVGALEMRRADKMESDGNAAQADFIAKALGGNTGQPASPAVIPAAPYADATIPADAANKVYANDELSPLDNLDLKQKIKGFEGFDPKAKWDYAQNTNGYGTKAAYAGEPIDRATAEARLGEEVAKARGSVDKFKPGLPTSVSDALTSLSFNAGNKWQGAGLGQAVQAGDMGAARDKFMQYNQAGGQVLPGLVNRRQQEAAWMQPPTQVAALGGMPTPDSQPAPQQAQQPNVQVAQALQPQGQQPQQPPQSAAIKEQIIRGLKDPNPYVRKQAQALGAALVQKQMDDGKTPDDVKKFEYGQKNPAYNQWEIERKRAGAIQNSVVIDQKGEGAFSTEAGKLQAKRFNDLADDAPAAKQMISDVETLRDLGTKIQTGKLAEVKAVLGPYASALGVDVKGLDEIQAFEAIINRVAPNLRVKGSGAQSDFELRNFLKSLPSLGNQEGGNEIASRVMTGLYENKLKAAEIGADALNGKISRSDAEKAIRDLPDPMKEWREFNKKAKAAPAAGAQAPTVIDGYTIRAR